jgi:histone-arginine methyltransferase CARM1
MLADHVRTGTYQQAFLRNSGDFAGKVVLDVGTGTGILAFFAIQAGAKHVYAVEASESCRTAQILVDANGYSDRITILNGKIEEIIVPEKVDIIISEPIGFLLVHERMLESYVVARDRFLKPNGLMMPTTGSIVIAPFTDDQIYKDQLNKISFWNCDNFYGVDLTHVFKQANVEYFSQPAVGYVNPSSIISNHRVMHTIDFSKVSCKELQNFEINFKFNIEKTCLMHGLAGWFDINFIGSTENVVLSTAPECPGTHWYQCRLLLHEPLAVNRGQAISGNMVFEANDKFSYNIYLTVTIDGTAISSSNRINLHDQMYSYLNS